MDRSSLLVADPDAIQRQLIDLLLSADDTQVVAVASGQEALAYLREHTPRALVLAVELTDIDGFALCQKVKAVGRLARVPVVIVIDPSPAGGIGERERTRARTAGADLLLQRPLGDKNLRERIERLILTSTDEPAVPMFDAGLTPVPTSAGFGVPGMPITPNGVQPASELGGLRAEVAHLRTENASLLARLAKYKALAKTLQEQLDEERRRPRGLFGRRG